MHWVKFCMDIKIYMDIKSSMHANKKIYRYNLFTHRTPRSSQELIQKCLCIPGSNWNLKMLVLRRKENRSTWIKTSQSRVENQQQTQPTNDAGSRNRTEDTLVGGKRSHHCAIPLHYISRCQVLCGHQVLWGCHVLLKHWVLWWNNEGCKFSHNTTGKMTWTGL